MLKHLIDTIDFWNFFKKYNQIIPMNLNRIAVAISSIVVLLTVFVTTLCRLSIHSHFSSFVITLATSSFDSRTFPDIDQIASMNSPDIFSPEPLIASSFQLLHDGFSVDSKAWNRFQITELSLNQIDLEFGLHLQVRGVSLTPSIANFLEDTVHLDLTILMNLNPLTVYI